MKTARIIFVITALTALAESCTHKIELQPTPSDLSGTELATRWDEAIPLGNASVGALIWKKDSMLRFSLDRTDLWDLRDLDSLLGPSFSFEWVKSKLYAGKYGDVQKKLDLPYNNEAAPTKIPGGALEFPLSGIGEPDSVHLYLNNALCMLSWPDGMKLYTFVQADKDCGWFRIENAPDDFLPEIVAPTYSKPDGSAQTDQSGADLARLGYKTGKITKRENGASYVQECFGDFNYCIDVSWKRAGKVLTGVWSITSSDSPEDAEAITENALNEGWSKAYDSHMAYWNEFNRRGRVSVPDPAIQRQYDNDHYKFGSAARHDSYPISLQAVWTADNGHLPPWKGDYHHDLNTQLSYWPAYTGNHLDEEFGYLNTLWNQREVYRDFTKTYFGKDGLSVPGVCTLDGKPLGGWIQYSMSQSCGAWLAFHFYCHWKHSADMDFLKDMAEPFIREAAEFAENITTLTPEGVRTLEISSSPEVFNNSAEAWFDDITNYDLSLLKNLFNIAAECADAIGKTEDAERWRTDASQMPELAVDENGTLLLAPGRPLDFSHRHFSHAISIYPLGLLVPTRSEEEFKNARQTLAQLDSLGPDGWTGYSYAWLGALKARCLDGEGAADAIRIFADCFVSPNTFHLNGDQSHSGKSKSTSRPFTLEGNFAAMAAVQEMLMQSHTGTIVLFPAIPEAWKNVSFERFLAQGGIEVSAVMMDGRIGSVKLTNTTNEAVTPHIAPSYTTAGISISLLPGETKVLSEPF